MQALFVTIQIKPEFRDAFMEAMLDDARGSLENEPGCLRFDVMQDLEDRNRIHLYEVYRDHAAIEAHRRTRHFIKWRDTVRDWHAAEPVRQESVTIFPEDGAWCK